MTATFNTMKPTAELELAAQTDAAPAVIQSQDPITRGIASLIERGVTSENVEAFDKLLSLYERLQGKDAERQFAAAFVALQSELNPIAASKVVPNNDGSARYKFAPYEEIMAAVRPLLLKHGFTVTFSMSFSEGRVTQACTLQHLGGHRQTNSFAVRIGKGPPGSSEAQGDGAASTYAKRFALTNALNITVETDSDGADARVEGEVISKDKLQYLRELVKETNSDEARFLAFAGVKTYEEITTATYPLLVRSLSAKRK